MKSRKLISLLMSIAMIASLISATVMTGSAASDAGLAVKPTVTAKAVEYATDLDMPTYLRIDFTMTTESSLTKFNALTGKGLALRMVDIIVDLDDAMFDESTATIMDENAKFDGGAVSNGVRAAFSATTDAATISDLSTKLFSLYVEAKDATKTIDAYNNSEFMDFVLCLVSVDEFTGKVSGKVQATTTNYRSDGQGDAIPATVIGNGSTEPTATPTAEPTATPTAEPTATPTAEPTATPTAEPTATPTAEPTATPTAEPADKVTVDETATAVADDTAYWGVKILEAAEANITAKFETDTESKEVTLVNAAGLDGNGDLAFNLYLKLTGERVGKAVTATVTVGEDSDSGVWAAAN